MTDDQSADPVIMGQLARLLTPFVDAIGEEPPTVQPGSVLDRLDNRLGDSFKISRAAFGPRVVAVDHLVASHNLLFGAHAMHPWAAMTLARGVMESGAIAAWLLSSKDDDERCRRTLRLWAQDLQDHISFEKQHDPSSEVLKRVSERRNRVFLKADELGLDRSWVAKPLHWQVVFDGVTADLNLHKAVLTPHLLWRLLSGLAHGRQWASVAGLHREEMGDAGGDGVRVKFTAQENALYLALLIGVTLVNAAKKEFDHERLAFRHSRASAGDA